MAKIQSAIRILLGNGTVQKCCITLKIWKFKVVLIGEVTQLSKVMEDFYGPENIPTCLYLYTDGSGDKKITKFKVLKSLISLSLYHDMDELVAARPAAGLSYKNHVGRCHYVGNLGLQSVGMMRTKCRAWTYIEKM